MPPNFTAEFFSLCTSVCWPREFFAVASGHVCHRCGAEARASTLWCQNHPWCGHKECLQPLPWSLAGKFTASWGPLLYTLLPSLQSINLPNDGVRQETGLHGIWSNLPKTADYELWIIGLKGKIEVDTSPIPNDKNLVFLIILDKDNCL